LVELIDLAHEFDVEVSTGGFIEYVLTQGPEAVDRYLKECKAVGFDTVEVSTGFITIPADSLVRLVERVQKFGMKPKPEVGIQFGAGGDTGDEELEAEGTKDVGLAIYLAKRCIEAGAPLVMIEFGRDNRERQDLAHRRGGTHHLRPWAGERHVRGRGPRSVRLVHQELRPRSQSFR
jgi:phosphosulfolactate synthase (CoM biosynthesis protein A)